MSDFQRGAFEYVRGETIRLNDDSVSRWAVQYNGRELAWTRLDAKAKQSEIVEALSHATAEFTSAARAKHAPDVLVLFRESDDEVLASCPIQRTPDGMASSRAWDSAQVWARIDGTKLCKAMSIDEFARFAAAQRAPRDAWIAGLLPEEVLTEDAAEWRAPTAWEIRHVVGEGSFTGVTGARAADLVGVVPQNFRKYTARDDAVARQSISFAMWHTLLHRLGVKTMGGADE
ncbi:hypothetical protein [Burkholderia gladioli]|uniref:hypothetical protein n=1 Tax=Burkholderia gladioli TaxID=28095 RepID=UPI00164010A8|nr:hypothetical protein [Burkholderia gladioli]